MTEFEQLHQAILDEPDDDTVRLAYADCLNENAGSDDPFECPLKGRATLIWCQRKGDREREELLIDLWAPLWMQPAVNLFLDYNPDLPPERVKVWARRLTIYRWFISPLSWEWHLGFPDTFILSQDDYDEWGWGLGAFYPVRAWALRS